MYIIIHTCAYYIGALCFGGWQWASTFGIPKELHMDVSVSGRSLSAQFSQKPFLPVIPWYPGRMRLKGMVASIQTSNGCRSTLVQPCSVTLKGSRRMVQSEILAKVAKRLEEGRVK